MSDEHLNERRDNDELLNAISRNDIAEVRRLLESGVSPSPRNTDLLTPLARAVDQARLEIMSMLFQHNVEYSVDELGYTELHLAVQTGDTVVLKMLLDYSKEKGYRLWNPKFGEHPVHTAAENGHLECLKLLQDAGLDIDAIEPFQLTTTLHYACECKFARGADVVRYLLDSGADINAVTFSEKTPLWVAASAGNFETIAVILQASPSPDLGLRDHFGETVLHAAASHCSLSTLQMLVEAGADIHARSKSNASILHCAAEAGRLDSVAWILENSSLQVDERGSHAWTPLHYTAAANQVEAAKFLLDRGAYVNARSTPGEHTPLHLAAAYIDADINAVLDDGDDDTGMVECLLLHGADVMALGDQRALISDFARGEDLHDWRYTATEEQPGPPLEGVYPLHCAAFSGNINIAEKLLAAGGDLHCRTSIKGSTPLHLAATQFLMKMVRFLIRNGANYTLEDYGGRTMIHHLAFLSRGKPERVKTFLVEEGIYEPEMDRDLDWRQCIENDAGILWDEEFRGFLERVVPGLYLSRTAHPVYIAHSL